MKKLSYREFKDIMINHNIVNGEDSKAITGVIVYKQDNWKNDYSTESRSYRVSSNNKAFYSGKIGNSVFGDSLDNLDLGVRLDWYKWRVDYCYMD